MDLLLTDEELMTVYEANGFYYYWEVDDNGRPQSMDYEKAICIAKSQLKKDIAFFIKYLDDTFGYDYSGIRTNELLALLEE